MKALPAMSFPDCPPLDLIGGSERAGRPLAAKLRAVSTKRQAALEMPAARQLGRWKVCPDVGYLDANLHLRPPPERGSHGA